MPQLEQKLYKSLNTIYQNIRTMHARAGSTQSFFELNANIENMEAFVECMKECHDFCVRHGRGIKSEGIRKILGEIEARYASEEFKELIAEIGKLKAAMDSGIKSVTIGVNLDNLMRPSEIMLMSVGKEPIGKATIFDRLLAPDKTAEPLTDIYARKCKNGTIDAVNEKLFSELDRLGGGYMKRFNTAVSLCYASSTDFLVKLTPQIDFYVGAKNLVLRAEQFGVPMCRPVLLHEAERRFSCRGMHDPVLSNKLFTVFLRDRIKKDIRRNNCSMDDNARILILTGTNNGGKTTYTRAAGINQILAQAGLYVGAESAEISPCDNIYVHFPKEEEAGVDASRFTEECREFRRTIGEVTDSSLVLMNESLSSTNPYDCLIIAEELMKIFADTGCRLIFTTHIPELTERALKINESSPKSRVGGLTAECDEKGEPTYRITAGVPDFSRNAEYIFRKFGISFEEYKSRKN